MYVKDRRGLVAMLPTMQHTSLEVIRDEHQALSALLRSMSLLLVNAHREDRPPPFDVLRAMLFYLDEFPERLHHRKESAFLFPVLRERCPELGPVLDRLEREHAAGELMVRELAHTLLAYEVLGEPRRQASEQAVQRYVAFYLEHMGVEEQRIIPAALLHLGADDWAALDAAFAANRDPLTGHEPDDVYRPLFSKIMRNAPVPIGLGSAS